ncbi:hypothetical protein MXB_4488 [Myxobolus squamalis]|nr:hypothetical protein MXB_4488 [Myxobolus squamalis]
MDVNKKFRYTPNIILSSLSRNLPNRCVSCSILVSHKDDSYHDFFNIRKYIGNQKFLVYCDKQISFKKMFEDFNPLGNLNYSRKSSISKNLESTSSSNPGLSVQIPDDISMLKRRHNDFLSLISPILLAYIKTPFLHICSKFSKFYYSSIQVSIKQLQELLGINKVK